MLGHCSYVFIHPIAKALKSRGNYSVSAINLNQPGSDLSKADLTPFEQLFPEPSLADLQVDIVVDDATGEIVATDAGGAEVTRFDPKPFSDRHDLSDLNEVVAEDLIARKYAELMQGFDIYQLHYMDRRWLCAFRYLPKNAKTVVTIMGSDLLRDAGVPIYKRQLAALERADLITTHSLETAEILQSKYGRHLKPKIRYHIFGGDPALRDRIDTERKGNGRQAFCERHNLPPERLIVCAGYNASPGQQHREVLAALERLPADRRRRLSVVLPLGYNGNPEYVASLTQDIRKVDLDITILASYLDDDELAQLRVASDVLVQVQISDAFSSSTRETMYAGNIVITGAWLPYGTLRRRGVYFREVERLDEITDHMGEILDSYARERERAAGNPEKVRYLFDPDVTTQTWVDVYDELMSSERIAGAA